MSSPTWHSPFFFFLKFLFFLFSKKCIYLAVLGLSYVMWCRDSVLVACGLQSCSITCEILVPWPETEPASPALQGRLLISEPPVRSLPFFLTLIIPSDMKWSHCSTDLHFSDRKDMWASVHVLIDHLYIFFGKCLFRFFYPLEIRLSPSYWVVRVKLLPSP